MCKYSIVIQCGDKVILELIVMVTEHFAEYAINHGNYCTVISREKFDAIIGRARMLGYDVYDYEWTIYCY